MNGRLYLFKKVTEYGGLCSSVIVGSVNDLFLF